MSEHTYRRLVVVVLAIAIPALFLGGWMGILGDVTGMIFIGMTGLVLAGLVVTRDYFKRRGVT